MEQLQSLFLSFKCDRSFGSLQPCEGGWYCGGCQKLVYDLRGRPEQEIQNIFAANNYKLCGMFEADRIRVNNPLPKWRKWAAAAVMALGFTSIHQTLLAQHVPEKIVIDTPKTSAENMVFGTVEDSAEFPGGIELLYKLIKNKLIPDESCLPGKKAFITFTIDTGGTLKDPRVLRSPFSDVMHKRIMAILQKSPKWKPGRVLGKPVQSDYTIVIIPVEKTDH